MVPLVNWRHYLLLLAINAGLIGLAMGLHYGHLHHSGDEERGAVEATDQVVPWPAVMKAGMVDGCIAQGADREQCTCIFDWWEQNASLDDYLAWSAAMATGRPISDEAAQTFARSGSACFQEKPEE